MTREVFLNELKSKILSLTDEERNEALQYYSDYFEEADDDEKVIAELGTPDDVAKIIIEKFASALTVKESDKKEDDNSEAERTFFDSALFYQFKKKDVKNLQLDFGAARIVVIGGDEISVETRGVPESDFKCSLDSDGTLTVSNTRRVPSFGFFNHDRKQRFCPRILITLPSKFSVDELRIKIGAGSLTSKNLDLTFNTGLVEVGAGNLVLKKIFGGKLNIRCGMGNCEMKGSVTGKSNVDCGMGSVVMDLRGKPEDYTFDTKVGLGEVKINDEKRATVGQSFSKTVSENHISIVCGLGSVKVTVEE